MEVRPTNEVKRNEKGFSLATILIIGIVCTLWISALFSAVLPSYRRVSKMRTHTVLRAQTEAVADWIVTRINAGDQTVDVGSIPGALGNGVSRVVASRTYAIPTTVTAGAPIPITGTITVSSGRYSTNEAGRTAGVPMTSYLYRDTWKVGAAEDPLWRTVRVDARVTGNNSLRKTLRVVLQPDVGANLPNAGQLARRGINYNGAPQYVVSDDDSRTGAVDPTGNQNLLWSNGNVVSGVPLDIAKANIKGNLVVATQPGGSTTRVDATAISGASIGGNTMLNGIGNSTVISATKGSYMPSLNMQQQEPPPVPSAPPNALSIPNITGNVTLTGGGAHGGNYKVNTVSISGKNTITVNATSANPVRIFVEGPNSSFSVSGQATLNNTGDPPALQIFYSGATEVKVSGQGAFKGLIYAPNAPVKLAGNAQGYGMVVADSITMAGGGSSGSFTYDRAFQDVTLPGAAGTKRTVSWEEDPQT